MRTVAAFQALQALKVNTFLLSRHFTSVVLVFAATTAPALAQVPPPRLSDDPSQSCAVATAADQKEEEWAAQHQSPTLSEALRSQSALWRLIVSPSTSYEDRIAAAKQGAALLSADFLPTLWSADAGLQSVPAGVNPNPCQFVWPNAFYARSPEAWQHRKERPIPGVIAHTAENRTILGFRIDLPQQAIDYPLDLQESEKTPWLWQVQRAVNLLEKCASQIFSTASRYPELAAAALEWRPTDFCERQVRLRNLASGPRGSATWVEAMTRLSLQDAPVTNYYLEVRAVIDSLEIHMVPERSRDLVHVAQIVILQQTKNQEMAAAAASLVAEMSRIVVSLPARGEDHPTATSILAVAKWAADRRLDVSSRYQFAAQVCKAVRDPECQSAMLLGGTNSEMTASLAKFEAWFAQQRSSLDERAAAENHRLSELAAEIHKRLDSAETGVRPN